jgi:hypothetical protein
MRQITDGVLFLASDAADAVTGTSSGHQRRSLALAARDIVVVGGGSYGTFDAGQLEIARGKGALEVERVLVVDRDATCQITRALPPSPTREHVVSDWDAFFDTYLASQLPNVPASPPSYIVPSPLMPHLMFEWLLRRARERWPARSVARRPLEQPLGTPYDRLGPDGPVCVLRRLAVPTHCVEPATCPVIRGPRTWEMGEALAALVSELAGTRPVAGPALLTTRHLTYGVGAFPVDEVLAAERLLETSGRSGAPVELVIGTVSACHGAVGILALGSG